jgi:hypothetical protein
MRWLSRRSVLLLGAAIAAGVISVFVWPGDVKNEPITLAHWIAIGGFLLTAVLFVLGAVAMLMAVTGAAWSVKNFDLDDYLNKMKKDK